MVYSYIVVAEKDLETDKTNHTKVTKNTSLQTSTDTSTKKRINCSNKWTLLNPKHDQHLISPGSKTAESYIEIMRMKEVTPNLRNCGC